MTVTKLPRSRTATDIYVDLYLRLSDGRDLSSLDARERELRAEAKRRNWQVRKVVIENDLGAGKSRNASAFKRRVITLPDGTKALRTIRPGFRSILDDFVTGQAQAVLAEDVDRLVRDFRDGEDLLDIAEMYHITVEGLSDDSLRLTNGGTDSERDRVRDYIKHANKSSRDTGRRVRAARVRQAQGGYWFGGVRPYGYQPVPHPDGKYQNTRYTLAEAEVAEIRRWRDAVMSDVPLRSVARDVREREVPAVKAGSYWQSPTIREILRRELNLGKTRVNEDGSTEELIPAIFTKDERDGLIEKLDDPRRTKYATGRAPCWLGTSIYLCNCGAVVEIQAGKGRAPAYRCSLEVKPKESIHIRRNAAHVDHLISEKVIAFYCLPITAELKPKVSSGVDVSALRQEVARLYDRKKWLSAMVGAGEMDEVEFAEARRTNRVKIEKAERELASAVDRNPADPMAAVQGVELETVKARWAALSLGERRKVVRRLMTVTIRPCRAGQGFDERAIEIKWLVGSG